MTDSSRSSAEHTNAAAPGMPAQPGLLLPAGGCGWRRLGQAGLGSFDTREWLRAQKGPTLLRPALGSSWAQMRRYAASSKTITNRGLNPSSVWGSCQSFNDEPDAISRVVCVSAGGNAFNLVTEIKLNLKKKKKPCDSCCVSTIHHKVSVCYTERGCF